MQQEFNKEQFGVKRAENQSANISLGSASQPQFGDKISDDARLKAQQISERGKETNLFEGLTDTAREKWDLQPTTEIVPVAVEVKPLNVPILSPVVPVAPLPIVSPVVETKPFSGSVDNSNLFSSSLETKPFENKPFTMDKPFATSSSFEENLQKERAREKGYQAFQQAAGTAQGAKEATVEKVNEFSAGVAGAAQGAKEVVQEKAEVAKEKGTETLATIQGYAQGAAETIQEKGNQFIEGAASTAQTAKVKGNEALATAQGFAQGAAETIQEKAQVVKEKGSEALVSAQGAAQGAAETMKEKGNQFIEGAAGAAQVMKEKGNEALVTAQDAAHGAAITVKEKGNQFIEGAAEAAHVVKEKAQVVAEETKEHAHSFAETVAEKAHDVSEYAKHLGESAKETVVQIVETVRTTGEKAKESVESAAHSVHDFFVPPVISGVPEAPPVPSFVRAPTIVPQAPSVHGLSLAQKAELKMDQPSVFTQIKEGNFKLRSVPRPVERTELKLDQATFKIQERPDEFKDIHDRAKADIKRALGSTQPQYHATPQERLDEMDSTFRRV